MTKEIELTQGKVALVDDEDYEWLNQWKWHADPSRSTYYARRNSPYVNGKRHPIKMHRVILGLKYGDGKYSDHINRNGLDNRRSNLRVVNNTENVRNSGRQANNMSGYIGVAWHKRDKKWQARIKANYKEIHLGYYDELEDAIKARRQGEIVYWERCWQ